MELEALESLFPMELRKESESKFQLVGLIPCPDHSQTNHVSVDISFSYPDNYPTDAPVDWFLTKTTGCIATDSSRLEDLENTIRSVVEDNLGRCMVYQVAECIQEWLRQNNEEEKSLHDLMTNAESRQLRGTSSEEDDSDYDEDDYSDSDYSDESSLEEEDQVDFKDLEMKVLCPESERVTRERFLEWKQEYDAMLLQAGLIRRFGAQDTRQTGKEQFLAMLTNRKKDDGSFNEALFENEDDLLDEEFED